MPQGLEAEVRRGMDGQAIRQAADLLSQQIWCWGQDIQRPEGNWLLETGFERHAPPADREGCSSVYTLELPKGRRVILRGFGLFFGDDQLGGIFLQRYDFRPKYTEQSTLERPPWSGDDLPKMKAPTESQRVPADSLTIDLIDWIATYEEDVAGRLGCEYRQSTLDRWTNNKRPIIPAKDMANAWKSLGLSVMTCPSS